jgi:hypothetical protein
MQLTKPHLCVAPSYLYTQVYGVQQMGRYKGNETLYENKALTTIKPKTTETDMDYNSTLARVFAGMGDEPQPTKGGTKATPAGALPGDIPLAGVSFEGGAACICTWTG